MVALEMLISRLKKVVKFNFKMLSMPKLTALLNKSEGFEIFYISTPGFGTR